MESVIGLDSNIYAQHLERSLLGKNALLTLNVHRLIYLQCEDEQRYIRQGYRQMNKSPIRYEFDKTEY